MATINLKKQKLYCITSVKNVLRPELLDEKSDIMNITKRSQQYSLTGKLLSIINSSDEGT
jgi:hypothetical protein